MEINLLKTDFQDAVIACMGVSPVRGVNPVLCNILIESIGPEQVSLKATDTELGIIVNCPAQIKQAGSVLINSKSISDIVRLLPEENINLKMCEGERLRLRSGKSSFAFNCLSPLDFPRLLPPDSKSTLRVNAKKLGDLVTKMLFAIPVDKTRYNVIGANLVISGNRLTLTSTDNYRLVHTYIELENPDQHEVNIILPKKAFVEITKVLESCNGEAFLSYLQNKLFVVTEHKTLMCQVLDGTFPDLVSAIPTEAKNILKFKRVDLIAAARRVDIFSADNVLTMSILDDKTLRLEAENTDRGMGLDEIDVEYSGEPLKIGFNNKYILEVLSAMSEEYVKLFINEPLEPTVFRRCDDSSYSCLVMPMNI